MSTLSAASLRHKPNITGRSTGSCPGDWRRFWATESERAGSNWRHLLDAAPTWKEAAEQYHRDRAGRPLIVEIEPERLKRLRDLLKDGTSFSQVYYEINSRSDGAAASTVEALMFALRRGGSALNESSNLRRLRELSEPQLHEVCARLQKFKPHIARAWTPAEVEALVGTWAEIKNG
jgi:transposase